VCLFFEVVFVVWFKKKVVFRCVFDKNYGWSLYAAKNMYDMFDSCVITVAFQTPFYLKIH
jgi:hypothetical protein